MHDHQTCMTCDSDSSPSQVTFLVTRTPWSHHVQLLGLGLGLGYCNNFLQYCIKVLLLNLNNAYTVHPIPL